MIPLLAIALIAAACGGGSDTPSASGSTTTTAAAAVDAPGVTATEVSIGYFYPHSGTYSALAKQSFDALEVAAAEANDNGGINGRNIVFKDYDDGGSDANTIVTNFRKAREEVFGLITGQSSTNTIVAPLADKDKIPHVFGFVPEALVKEYKYGFTSVPYLSTQAKIMPSYILNRLNGKGKKIGLVFEDSESFYAGRDVFKAEAKKAGLEVVLEQPLAQSPSTCTNEITNLQTKGVDMLVQMVGPLGAICLYRDAKALGFKPTMTAFGASQQINAVAAGSGGANDGVRTLGGWPTLEEPAAKHFAEMVTKYKPDSKAGTNDSALLSYGYAQIFIEGMRRAGKTLNRETFKTSMETKMNGYESGILPPPHFGPGDRSGPQTMNETACCTDGKWTTVDATWHTKF